MNSYINTVRSLLMASKEKDALEVFKPAYISSYVASHDSWNGGIDFYNIDISIPTTLYVKLKTEKKIENIQVMITSAFEDATKADESTQISQVLLVPVSDINEEPTVTSDTSRIWKAGYFKMFISHLTDNKTSASNLKEVLYDYGISGFVAHEDVEPATEWQDEIEKALYTMDALAAIFVPNFIKSKWCDQELGFAMGRNKLVIPICKDALPYGFAGKYQGIKSNNKNAKDIANDIFRILCRSENSKIAYTNIMANLFLNSKTKDEAVKWINLISEINDIDTNIIIYIHSNYENNSNIQDENVLTLANKLFENYSLESIQPQKQRYTYDTTDNLPF